MALPPQVEKIKTFIKEKKGLALLIGVGGALGIYLVLESMSSKPAPSTTDNSLRNAKSVQLSSPKDNLVGVALDQAKKTPATPGMPPGSSPTDTTGAIPAPAPNIPTPAPLAQSTTQTPTPITSSAPQVEASGKPTSAMERFRMLYYNAPAEAAVSANDSANSQASAQRATKPPVAPVQAIQPQQPQTLASGPVNSTQVTKSTPEFIVPGTQIEVILISGAVTTPGRDAKIAGVVGRIVGPRNISKNFAGCMALGSARLDEYTTRVSISLKTISCPTKQLNLNAYARDTDYVEGIRGRYYSRITDRLLMSILPSLGTSYSQAKMEALKQTSTSVTGDVITQQSNIPNANTYALTSAFESGFNALQTELEALKTKIVAANVIDPGSRITFMVESMATVQNLYEVSK